MSEQNGGPTLATEAFRRLTTVVRAQKCGVDLLIRRIADYELMDVTADLPTAGMDKEQALAYFEAMAPEARAEYLRKGEASDERLIILATLRPKIVSEYSGEDGALPVALLKQDRVFLVRAIVEFSRLLPEPPVTVPKPGPAEVPAEGFRAGVEAPGRVQPGDGAPVEPGAPARQAGV